MEETSLEGESSSKLRKKKFREIKVFKVTEERSLEGERSSKLKENQVERDKSLPR